MKKRVEMLITKINKLYMLRNMALSNQSFLGAEMIFYASHPAAYKPDKVTYKVTVDLDKLKEKVRKN